MASTLRRSRPQSHVHFTLFPMGCWKVCLQMSLQSFVIVPCKPVTFRPYLDTPTGSAPADASDIHRQVPTNMAGIRRDWLTNQNTFCCFVVIGLSTRQSHSPLLQLKIDPVRQLGPPYWLASIGYQRIFINIRGQYGIQKNIYIHPWTHESSSQSWPYTFWSENNLIIHSCKQ